MRRLLSGLDGRGRLARRLGVLAASGLAAFAVSGVTAGAAQADDIHLEFDEAVINLGTLQGGQLIDPATDPPATQDGEIDPETGDFTVQPEDFFIPEKTFVDVQPGINAEVAMSIDEPATGNLDIATGALTEDLDLTAVIDIISGGSTLATCTVSDIPLTLETTGTLPGDPDDFDAAPFAPPTGEGAVVELWDNIPASTGDPVICPIVDGTIGGPGGIWFSGLAEVSSGEPFHLELTHGMLKLGSQPELEFLSEEEPATFDGTIDPETGEFTVPVDGVVLPPTEFSMPVAGTITATPQQEVTGTFDDATGDLDMSMVVTSVTEVPGLGAECTFADFEWDLSTSNTTPFQGAPFTEGLEGPGGIVASWADLPPVSPNAEPCITVRNLGAGPGGILMERPAGPPPAPVLEVSVDPEKAKVKQGQSTNFSVNIENTGDVAATGVEACAKVGGKIKVKPKCTDVDAIPASETRSADFKFKAKKKAKPKKYTLKFTVSATGLEDQKAEATLRVKKK
jgi:hypothetical protein